jgi:hypothetical protein
MYNRMNPANQNSVWKNDFPSERGIARKLVFPTEINTMFVIGGTRVGGGAYGFDVAMLTYCDKILWSGAAGLGFGQGVTTTGHRASIAFRAVTPTISPELGGQMTWFGNSDVEVISLGTEPAVALYAVRLATSTISQANHPLLFNRLTLGRVRAWNCYRKLNQACEKALDCPDGYDGWRLYIAEAANQWTTPSVAADWTTNTIDYIDKGFQYGYSECYKDAGYNWGADTIVAWSTTPNKQNVPTGQILSLDETIIRVELPGTVYINWTVANSNLSRWTRKDIWSDDIFTKLIKLKGPNPTLLLEVNYWTETEANIRKQLRDVIARFRLCDPMAPVIIINGYETSTTGSNPIWLNYFSTEAAKIPGVLYLDTFHTLPNYATGVSLGYYQNADLYNATGRAVYAQTIGNLLYSVATT